MAVFLIGTINVREPSLWAQYVAGVADSLEPFDAQVVFRGRKLADLAGTQPKEAVVILRFQDAATADAWFQSARYQALIPLRDQAADVVITTYSA